MRYKSNAISLTSGITTLMISGNDIVNILTIVSLGITIITTLHSVYKDFKRSKTVNIEAIIKMQKDLEETVNKLKEK